jgi:two-component system CheB/CheR fusion protein
MGPERDAAGLEALLEYLRERRGFDFSGYKRSTLERRIAKRMDDVGIGRYSEYQDRLEVTPGEFTDLFNTILINVTSFFRDQAAWDYLAADVIPRLAARSDGSHPVRVWSAACSSGEEACTIAMLFAEALGEQAFRERVKIYATDVDDDALASARQAVFDSKAVEAVPPPLLDKYFEHNGAGYAFRPEMRRSIIFGRNDLVQDAPIGHIDLLVSRNALMYFTRATQARILANFNFALEEDGFLFLGKSEMLLSHTDLFTPHNLKFRVFQKVALHGFRERLPFVTPSGGAERQVGGDIRTTAADRVPVAQIVVNRAGFVVTISERARELFGLGPSDVGRPFHDLDISYRPVDLRSAIEDAYSRQTAVILGRVEFSRAGDARVLSAEIAPLADPSGAQIGVSITFQDVTELALLDAQFRDSRQRLETAYEELQSTVEELETTNEELQSTNEELETTNEELQSTNEELETLNEELHSTNAELESLNDEQREGARQLDRLNLFLEGILGNLGLGVVVLDTDQRVQIWNAASEELWGVRPEETEGREFDQLDIGLPVGRLRESIERALADGGDPSEITLEAVNRRGRPFNCVVRTLALTGSDGRRHGAVLLMGDGADADGGLRDGTAEAAAT